ncbi:MAG TPA: class I SAM-dependent methyltransferase [Pirellulales bacterium]|nr:class I SAM-dependent methyltransferase [Pirellulales bacterium]
MGVYASYILPRILDFAMRQPQVAAERPKALKEAFGDVLEIGFGTGLNLPFYPPTVKRLTALDRARMLPTRVGRRLAAAPFGVELSISDAANLPFETGRFDCVVSTWTLCSIADVSSALAEIARVLRPSGRFLFLEHGLSCDAVVARQQGRWNPWQRLLAGGCNLNRPIDRLVESAGFEVVELDRFTLPDTLTILAPHYRGIARVRPT